MITDDVRREVAAKMREIYRENPDVSLQGMVASAMNECLPEGMEFGTGDAENSSFGAMWALEWIPNHMRDMQEAACETFESY